MAHRAGQNLLNKEVFWDLPVLSFRVWRCDSPVSAACAPHFTVSVSLLANEHRRIAMERPARVVASLPATLAPGGSIELSPFDLANQGRAIPMVWFYRETLDPALLLAALRETLKSYPVLCGRYGTPPNRVELNNQGIPVDIVHQETSLNEAVAHLAGQPTIFAEDAHLPFVPDKGAMDPDLSLIHI